MEKKFNLWQASFNVMNHPTQLSWQHVFATLIFKVYKFKNRTGGSIMNITLLGIDIAKNVFQLQSGFEKTYFS